MNDAIKFTWAYMLEEGHETCGQWSYYGSSWEPLGNSFNYHTMNSDMDEIRRQVKEVGIDWTKTSTPESDMHSCFNGTFAKSSDAETLLGTLVFLDGAEYIIGVDNAETRFTDYMKHLQHFMEDKERMRNILGE